MLSINTASEEWRDLETEHSSWLLVSAQRFAVPHVQGTLSAQIGPLHQQVGQPVHTHADGERGEEAVQTPQHNAQGPAENQQHQQPDDAPETRAARHPPLQEHQTQLFIISCTHYSFFQSQCIKFTKQCGSPEEEFGF